MAAVTQRSINLEKKNNATSELKKIGSAWETVLAIVILGAAAGLFFAGRALWDETYYTADDGLGYYLGLVGGVMMLAAYVYSLRKHAGFMKRVGTMPRWLRIHIAFGVVGPFLVILHTTFQFQSINGTLAFFSMILVMASGVLGRYLYSRIHFGLYGRKARLKELQQIFGIEEESAVNFLSAIPSIKERLQQFLGQAMVPPRSFIGALKALFITWWHTRRLYRELHSNMHKHLAPLGQQLGWDPTQLNYAVKRANELLREYLRAVDKVALFSAYDRLFTLWRMVHIPLLYLLFFSGVLHVVAVHMY